MGADLDGGKGGGNAVRERRLPFVDALRGLAVAGMLVIHQSEWWLAPAARRTDGFALLYFFSKAVAPTFLTLVGVALVLRFQGRPPRRVHLHAVLRRGVKILALGYLLNLAVWGPVWGIEELACWDVLQLIGVALPVCALLLRLPWWARLTAAGGIVWLSTRLTLRHLSSFPPYLADIVHGRTPPAYFPLVPWVVYPLAGTVLGEAYLTARRASRLSRFAATVGAVGMALLLLGAAGRPWRVHFDPDELWLTEFSHPGLDQLAFAGGVVLVLFAAFSKSHTQGCPMWTDPLVRMGQNSLFIYCLHHLVGYTLFYFLGWHNRFGSPAVAAMLSISFVLTYILLRALPGSLQRFRAALR